MNCDKSFSTWFCQKKIYFFRFSIFNNESILWKSCEITQYLTLSLSFRSVSVRAFNPKGRKKRLVEKNREIDFKVGHWHWCPSLNESLFCYTFNFFCESVIFVVTFCPGFLLRMFLGEKHFADILKAASFGKLSLSSYFIRQSSILKRANVESNWNGLLFL